MSNAVVVGSGPNGLAAAIKLALEGWSVVVFEKGDTVGGGCRSAELTLPGFTHDICSSIHPLAIGSPFFRQLPLSDYGVEWIHPLAPLAHPFEDGTAAILERSIEETGKTLGIDQIAYQNRITPFVENWDKLENTLLGPLQFPRHPLAALLFGLSAVQSAEGFANRTFKGEKGRAFFAGLAAHSILPLDRAITTAFGLVLGILGHVYGWPMPKGGSQKIADALAAYFISLGGKIVTDHEVKTIDELPSARATLLDVTPRQALQLAGHRFPEKYRKKLQKYRYGPGVFKIDWALDGPIPWKAEECLRAGTVHLGGTLEEIVASEKMIWEGKHQVRPYVLVAQHSLFDETRAPPGKQTAWAYCHVPSNSTKDMTEEIENQVERFAPGFRERILAKKTTNTAQLEAYNPNCVGGDISGGVLDIWQLFTRPTLRWDPYSTPVPGLFFCSSSTPPGGGVHGMCGYHAAKAALKIR